jgi:hypothetical protein
MAHLVAVASKADQAATSDVLVDAFRALPGVCIDTGILIY